MNENEKLVIGLIGLFIMAMVGSAIRRGRIRWLRPMLRATQQTAGRTRTWVETEPAHVTPLGRKNTHGYDRKQATRDAAVQLTQAVSFVAPRQQLNYILRAVDGWHAFDLAKNIGHWGVFGSTRSGKGYFLQVISISLLLLGPEKIQVWVLDPKQGLDYAFCTKLQHARLYADEDGVDGSLTDGYNEALEELRRRNAVLRQANCRNIHEYNARHPANALSFLILICDEVAEVDQNQKKALHKLARTAAAAGIILFLATQYPTAEVLSSQVQANVLNRVVLRLSSSKYTEVALGLAPGEPSMFDPAAFDEPGLAILRRDGGTEVVGRVPNMPDDLRDSLVEWLVDHYEREPVETNIVMSTEENEDLETPITSEVVARPAIVPAIEPNVSDDNLTIRVATVLAREPNISTKALAEKVLNVEDGRGYYSAKIKPVRLAVERVVGLQTECVSDIKPEEIAEKCDA